MTIPVRSLWCSCVLAAMLALGGYAIAGEWKAAPPTPAHIAWKTIPAPTAAARRNREIASAWRQAFVRPFTRVGAFGDFGHYLAPIS